MRFDQASNTGQFPSDKISNHYLTTIHSTVQQCMYVFSLALPTLLRARNFSSAAKKLRARKRVGYARLVRIMYNFDQTLYLGTSMILTIDT